MSVLDPASAGCGTLESKSVPMMRRAIASFFTLFTSLTRIRVRIRMAFSRTCPLAYRVERPMEPERHGQTVAQTWSRSAMAAVAEEEAELPAEAVPVEMT